MKEAKKKEWRETKRGGRRKENNVAVWLYTLT